MASKSFISNRRNSVLVTGLSDFSLSFHLPQNRNRWREDQQCKICYKNLGMGFRSYKKCHCKFCYRAVCKECSKQKVDHPQTQLKQRICDQCEGNAMEKQYQQGYADELTKVVQDKDFIQSEIKLQIQKKKLLKTQSFQIQQEIAKLNSEQEDFQKMEKMIEDLKVRKQRLEEQNREIGEEIKSTEDQEEIIKIEMEDLQTQVQMQKQIDNRFREEISQLRNELAELQDQKVRKMHIIQEKFSYCRVTTSTKKEETLLKQLQELKEINQRLQNGCQIQEKQIYNLRHQYQLLKTEKKNIKEQLLYFNKNPVNQLLSNEERLKMIEFISKIENQQKHIDILRKRKELKQERKLSRERELYLVQFKELNASVRFKKF